MDSAVGTAARALGAGDPLAALQHVALRSDPPALALRGIALAQLGELSRARTLLRRAARAFGTHEPGARARCVVAEAEVALAQRDLRDAGRGLDDAVRTLALRGDAANAALGRLIQARRAVWLGRLDEAEAAMGRLTLAGAPARLVAQAALTSADVATRRARARSAEASLATALDAARVATIPALVAEVEHAIARLAAPVARRAERGASQPLSLAEVEALYDSDRLLLDVCRRELRRGRDVTSLRTRPLLARLLETLAERSPAEVPRDELIARVFGARRANDSHRVRLRVEVGRLRRVAARHVDVVATPGGYALVPRGDGDGDGAITRLVPVEDGEASALWALLQGGEAWATSALADALGRSQRAVQRALAELEADGRARAVGAGRARRWVAAPGAGFATTLLLLSPASLG